MRKRILRDDNSKTLLHPHVQKINDISVVALTFLKFLHIQLLLDFQKIIDYE